MDMLDRKDHGAALTVMTAGFEIPWSIEMENV